MQAGRNGVNHYHAGTPNGSSSNRTRTERSPTLAQRANAKASPGAALTTGVPPRHASRHVGGSCLLLATSRAIAARREDRVEDEERQQRNLRRVR